MAAIDDLSSRRLYHGTKADLNPGDLVEPGHRPNFGKRDRTATYVYLTGTLEAATWGAELALGKGPGRVYLVEPTGPIDGRSQSDGQGVPVQSDAVLPPPGAAASHGRGHELAGALPRSPQGHEGQP